MERKHTLLRQRGLYMKHTAHTVHFAFGLNTPLCLYFGSVVYYRSHSSKVIGLQQAAK